MKKRRFYESILRAEVIFLTDCNVEEINTWVKRYTKKDPTEYEKLSGSVTFLDNSDKKGATSREYLLIVEDKKDFYTLLHETNHLVCHILCDRGIPYERENSETIAYFETWWFKQLWRFMAK